MLNNKSITINFSEDEVKLIIADYLKREGYDASVKDITLSISTRCEGYDMAEHKVNYFEGACVNCKKMNR